MLCPCRCSLSATTCSRGVLRDVVLPLACRNVQLASTTAFRQQQHCASERTLKLPPRDIVHVTVSNRNHRQVSAAPVDRFPQTGPRRQARQLAARMPVQAIARAGDYRAGTVWGTGGFWCTGGLWCTAVWCTAVGVWRWRCTPDGAAESCARRGASPGFPMRQVPNQGLFRAQGT